MNTCRISLGLLVGKSWCARGGRGAGDGTLQNEWMCGACLGRLHGGEVLHVVTEVAAQVLGEPVEQRCERQPVPRPGRSSRRWAGLPSSPTRPRDRQVRARNRERRKVLPSDGCRSCPPPRADRALTVDRSRPRPHSRRTCGATPSPPGSPAPTPAAHTLPQIAR